MYQLERLLRESTREANLDLTHVYSYQTRPSKYQYDSIRANREQVQRQKYCCQYREIFHIVTWTSRSTGFLYRNVVINLYIRKKLIVRSTIPIIAFTNSAALVASAVTVVKLISSSPKGSGVLGAVINVVLRRCRARVKYRVSVNIEP